MRGEIAEQGNEICFLRARAAAGGFLDENFIRPECGCIFGSLSRDILCRLWVCGVAELSRWIGFFGRRERVSGLNQNFGGDDLCAAGMGLGIAGMRACNLGEMGGGTMAVLGDSSLVVCLKENFFFWDFYGYASHGDLPGLAGSGSDYRESYCCLQ